MKTKDKRRILNNIRKARNWIEYTKQLSVVAMKKEALAKEFGRVCRLLDKDLIITALDYYFEQVQNERVDNGVENGND